MHTQRLGNIVPGVFTPVLAKHTKSFNLATQVAGWRGWNELGRRIKQGEKGILIFAPILSEAKQPADTDASSGETAEPQEELLGFRQVRVWDVSQTEGEPVAASDLFSDLSLSTSSANRWRKNGRMLSLASLSPFRNDNLGPIRVQ